jgi:DNA/RNA-binding domain of Phe-tRNA-synthetase-like protein
VALRAFDAERLEGAVSLRLAEPGERLGGAGIELPEGTLVIADERSSVGLIFGETAPDREATRDTRQVAICALGVQGVPMISIEEAIWSAAGVLSGQPHFAEG